MLHCFSHSPSLTHFLVEVLPALQGCHQSVRLWLLRMYAHSSHFNKEPLIATVHTHYYLLPSLLWTTRDVWMQGLLAGVPSVCAFFCCNLIFYFPERTWKINACMDFLCNWAPTYCRNTKGCTSHLKNMHLYLTWYYVFAKWCVLCVSISFKA